MKSNKASEFTAGPTIGSTRGIGKTVNKMDLQKLRCRLRMVRPVLSDGIRYGKEESEFRHFK